MKIKRLGHDLSEDIHPTANTHANSRVSFPSNTIVGIREVPQAVAGQNLSHQVSVYPGKEQSWRGELCGEVLGQL